MNRRYEEYKRELVGKKVAAVGLGISNRPLVRCLAKLGVEIVGFDSAPYAKLESFILEFKDMGNVSFFTGPDYLENLVGFDIIFKTPAIRPDVPEFVKELRRGALMTSEMEVFMKMCSAKIIAVTGSEGKTTTTTLIGKMLQEQGFKVWVGGNIGTPLFNKLDEIEEDDMVVLELGSFQLQTIRDKSPEVAVITNISPNHLDFHKIIDEYIWSKKNIYRYQKNSDKLVLNHDNKITAGFQKDAEANVIWFSRQSIPENGAYLDGERIVYYENGEENYLFDKGVILLKGIHHVENYMAAISAVYDYVDVGNMKKVAGSFKGVEHRTEPVKEVNGVWYYNDSIGSSPTRTNASIHAFEGKVILIAGGYDKKIPYDIMGPLIIEKVKGLILVGQTGPKIKAAFEDEKAKTGNGHDIPVVEVSTDTEAVFEASKMAIKGDIVLLSPASASYDMYPNFEVRGKTFKDAVKNLK